MTNRMVIGNPQMGMFPQSQAEWSAIQREMAEATAPGFSSLSLLDDFVESGTAPASVLDKNSDILSISLRANVKYYIGVFGSYNREDTNDVKFQLSFDGVTAGQPEDSALAHYINTAGVEVSDHLGSPLALLTMASTVGAGYTFGLEGFMSVSVEGELIMTFSENTGSGVSATLYAGTRLIAQPILNLSDRGNP